MTVAFDSAIPVLRSFSFEKAREFYLDFLGFRIDWEHRFAPDLPLYMQISRAGLKLHVSEHHGDGSPGAGIFVKMTGIEEFQRELGAKQYGYLRPSVQPAPWDARDKMMVVTDPFANRITFVEYPA